VHPQSKATLHQAVDGFRAGRAGGNGLVDGFSLVFMATFRGFLVFRPPPNPPGQERGQGGGKGQGGGDHAVWELLSVRVPPEPGGGVIR
jgi:hypothetical protein